MIGGPVLAGLLAWAAPGGVLIEADAPPPPAAANKRWVHGRASLGVAFGVVSEDPIAALVPALELDFRERAPVRLALVAPVRLRLVDRAPEDGTVLRRLDWDEVGDGLAVLRALTYADDLVFRTYGRVRVDLRLGRLDQVRLGHGAVLDGFGNSWDVDRRRAGLDLWTRVEGRLLGVRAGVETQLVATDLAGGQVLGGRVALDWAGAALGFVAAGDPTAPRALARGEPDTTVLRMTDRHALVAEGRRGASALALELAYRGTDGWRWFVQPRLDLALLPGLGRGLVGGLDTEWTLGKRRRVRLGDGGEVTVSSRSFDPSYFDRFYLYQRWQVPFVASPTARPADLADRARPKWAFVDEEDLSGVGGAGRVRVAHEVGVYAQVDARWRPGPLGGTFALAAGIDLPQVRMEGVWAHRGRTGFELGQAAGTLGSLRLAVPALRWLEVTADLGWLVATRPDPPGVGSPGVTSGLVTHSLQALAGVAGVVPW